MLVIKEEVKKALEEGRAVVALESTIIAHGMPYPENLETAKAVEAIVREAGAVPATMAILDGVLKVGLDDEELEYLATTKEALKVSRRDLPYVVSEKKSGATTVAATMIMAKMAGIRFLLQEGLAEFTEKGRRAWMSQLT